MFAGGWTLETAAAMFGEDADEFEVLDLLTRLVDKRKVRRDRADAEAVRLVDGLHNRIFLDPLLHGRYPADVLEHVGRHTGQQQGGGGYDERGAVQQHAGRHRTEHEVLQPRLGPCRERLVDGVAVEAAEVGTDVRAVGVLLGILGKVDGDGGDRTQGAAQVEAGHG